MDLAGRFPKKSSRDNEYILVAYHYDGNYIQRHPVKDRKGHTIAEAWKQIHSIFKKAGNPPEICILDNETLEDLKNAFNQENIIYQLVTPYKHCNNQAERAIQTFKSHFKSDLAGTDPEFPLAE